MHVRDQEPSYVNLSIAVRRPVSQGSHLYLNMNQCCLIIVCFVKDAHYIHTILKMQGLFGGNEMDCATQVNTSLTLEHFLDLNDTFRLGLDNKSLSLISTYVNM